MTLEWIREDSPRPDQAQETIDVGPASTRPVSPANKRFSRFLYAVSLKAVIASIQARGVVIFAIDTRFVTRNRAGFEEEQRLGLESGGRCFEFGSDKELQNAFKSIQASIENQYFLTYAPTHEPHAKISVKAEHVRICAPRLDSWAFGFQRKHAN